jgi:hypothetical protein
MVAQIGQPRRLCTRKIAARYPSGKQRSANAQSLSFGWHRRLPETGRSFMRPAVADVGDLAAGPLLRAKWAIAALPPRTLCCFEKRIEPIASSRLRIRSRKRGHVDQLIDPGG